VFKIQVDLSLVFIPPMEEHGAGIHLHRQFEIPFVPFEGMHLTGKAFDENHGPMGFKLVNITWDLDRKLFFAETTLVSSGFPIALILDDIRSWVDRSWQLGSIEDLYATEEEETEGEEEGDGSTQCEEGEELDLDEEMETWPQMSPRKRPPHFNRLMQAMVRQMAESFNNSTVAYAIDRTKLFFSEEELKDIRSKASDRFRNAESEFYRMSSDEKLKWRDRVMRKYPSIEQLLNEE